MSAFRGSWNALELHNVSVLLVLFYYLLFFICLIYTVGVRHTVVLIGYGPVVLTHHSRFNNGIDRSLVCANSVKRQLPNMVTANDYVIAQQTALRSCDRSKDTL